MLRRDLTPQVISRFFESLDTPVSLACDMLYRYGEHEQLAKKTISARDYASSDSFYPDYLAVRFLSKFTGLKTGIDTRAVALEEFLRCERKCQVLNDQLTDLYVEDPIISLNSKTDWRFSRIITWLQCKISDTLGPLEWSEVLDKCRFGPGSTTRVGGTKTSAYEKFKGTPHSTREALPYVLGLSEQWENFPHRFSVTLGNVVTFVLKNAKTDRTIAMEPCMNQFMQFGPGGVIQDRLKRFNVDIRDQTRNQRLAYRGSLDGSCCTVDMTSASGLISRVVPELLLPGDWFEVMNALRSHRYTLDGREGVYHSFSSMGNGFTFPLQTLIFWSLATLACKMSDVGYDLVSVYGDDVIVPVQAFDTFLRLLTLFGFEPNSAKSFGTGPFRESCGKDYFNGRDCQPLYLKEPLLESMELVKFANRVRRLSFRSRNGFGCDSRFHAIWQYCVSQLPRDLQRCRIPEGYGDGGLVASFEEACPSVAPHANDGNRYDFVSSWKPSSRGVPLGYEGFTYTRWVFVPEQYEMEDIEGTLRVALFSAQGIKAPLGGWMVNARTSELDSVSGEDALQDFDVANGCPDGHQKATHRRKGKWVRRRGVARNWPSLGSWF